LQYAFVFITIRSAQSSCEILGLVGCLGGLASADSGVANPGTLRTGGQLKRSTEATSEVGVMLDGGFAAFVKKRVASFHPCCAT